MFSKSSKSLTHKDILDLSDRIGYNLPNDFIEHYEKNNGGVAEDSGFYVAEEDTFVEVSFFLPIKYVNSDLSNMLIESSYENLVAKGVQKKYLPFAIDWGGNYFSINLETNDVVLLLMDLGEFNEEDAVKYLTTGFLNFIDNLEEVEEEDV